MRIFKLYSGKKLILVKLSTSYMGDFNTIAKKGMRTNFAIAGRTELLKIFNQYGEKLYIITK